MSKDLRGDVVYQDGLRSLERNIKGSPKSLVKKVGKSRAIRQHQLAN